MAGDAAIFAALYAVLVAVLVTMGFAIETIVYRLAGWTQGLDSIHLFDAADQHHLVFTENLIVLVVWVAAGAMLGAAFYRNGGLGMALLPVGLAAVMVVEAGTGPGYFGPLPPPLLEVTGLELGGFSVLGAAATAPACCVVLGAIAWRTVRDVPVRPEAV